MPVKIGESGQPCEKSSTTSMASQEPSSSLTIDCPLVAYSMSTKGSRFGKSAAMMCLNFCLEIELNMFFMSMDSNTLVGRRPLSYLLVMYFPTPRRTVEMMKSMPPFTPNG